MSEINSKFGGCHFIYKQIFITFNFILYEVTITSYHLRVPHDLQKTTLFSQHILAAHCYEGKELRITIKNLSFI